ncbi:hypothetical protein NA78x_000345 [Anatilimnocola sp. NA78]|uniref:hypothetical protein n=1 Tax=Anatilimnocola sp. NA78 TaxID=3415683 RepID=UPI003CE4DAEB
MTTESLRQQVRELESQLAAKELELIAARSNATDLVETLEAIRVRATKTLNS